MSRRLHLEPPDITPKEDFETRLEVNLFGYFKLLEETHWSPSKECDRIEGRKSQDLAVRLRENADRITEVAPENHLQIQASLAKALSFVRPNTFEECSLFAKRSKLWHRLGRYESSLLDLNRALRSVACPASLRSELTIRRKDCLEKIRRRNATRLAVASALFEDGSFVKKFPTVFDGYFIPLEVDSDHSALRVIDVCPEGLSEAVRVVYHSLWGRFLVATRDIAPGEILSKEEMFVCSPYPMKGMTNCGHCMVKCDSSFPCDKCVYEVYCSENCRREAFESYHRVECRIKPYLMRLMGSQDCSLILAVRAFLRGTKQGAILRKLMQEDSYTRLFEDELRPVQKINSINKDYAIICNQEGRKPLLDTPDLSRCTKVILILRCINFFQNCPEMNECYVDFTGLAKMELFSMKILAKHLISIRANSFVVAEYTNDSPFTSDLPSSSRVGESLLCNHAMLNHSCNPNAAEFTKRRNHVLYSIQPIRQYEQIFISYDYCHFDSPLEVRKQKHTDYGFDCRCQACLMNWPTYRELAQQPPVFITKDRNLQIKMERTDELMWDISNPESFNRGDTVLKQYQEICEYLKELNAYVSKPSAMIVRGQVLIDRCMRSLSNFYIESSSPDEDADDEEEPDVGIEEEPEVGVEEELEVRIEEESDFGVEEESEYGVEAEIEAIIAAERERRRRGWRRFFLCYK